MDKVKLFTEEPRDNGDGSLCHNNNFVAKRIVPIIIFSRKRKTTIEEVFRK